MVVNNNMKVFFVAKKARRLAVLVACLFCLAAALSPCAPPAAKAATLTDDHILLYYLIEMQRQAKRSCDGVLMPEAPSLLPSESLRDLAGQSIASGKSPSVLAEESGLAGAPYLAVTAHGSTPQQAFYSLLSGQCQALMNPALHYIGAAASNGQWTVIMAASEPGQAPAAGLTTPPPAATADQAAQSDAPEQAHAAAAAPGDAPILAQAESVGPSRAADIPGGINMKTESLPADPIVVEELKVDPLGRVIFPGSRQGVSPDSGQNPGQGAGRNAEPARTSPAPEPAPGVTPLEDTRSSSPGPQSAVLFPATESAPQGAAAPFVPAGAYAGAESDMLGQINAARARGALCGSISMPPAPPLRANGKLTSIANSHAADMTARGYFSSTTPEGRGVGRRVADAGYVWQAVAENLARGAQSAQDAVLRWMSHESQCRNIMKPEYTDAGLGFDPSGPKWVLILAVPMETGTAQNL